MTGYSCVTSRFSLAVSTTALVSMLCCLSILFSSFAGSQQRLGSHINKTICEQPASAASESSPSLHGEEAVSWLKQQGAYDSLRSSIETSRYRPRWIERQALPEALHSTGGAYTAANPAQQLLAYFTSDEMMVVPNNQQTARWQFGMKLSGYGYGPNVLPVAAGEIKAAGNRIEIDRARVGGKGSGSSNNSTLSTRRSALTEWYINMADGLEQGFTLYEPPGENMSGERLRVAIEVRGNLNPRLQSDGRGVMLESEDGRQTLSYSGLKAYDRSGKELRSELVAESRRIWLEVDDREAQYPVTIDPVVREVKLITASDGEANERFGASVAISGDTVVVGSEDGDGASERQGAAYVFERHLGGPDNWGEVKKLTSSDGESGDRFGSSVAISGDTIVVSALAADVGDDFDQGSVYVFERNRGGANNWGELRKLTASDGGEEDFFGISVSITDRNIVVGASLHDRGKNENQGAAYVFERNRGGTNNWGEVKKITASDGEEGDQFGISVSISGETIVAGASLHDFGENENRGSAYVYERNRGGADNWGEVREFAASDGKAGDRFGQSISISVDTVVVGATGHNIGQNIDQGAAYVFERNLGGVDNWGEVRKLIASDGQSLSIFGNSVAISVDTVVVGASNQDAAYVFERNRGGADNWGEVQKLTASDGQEGDQFGSAVAISGNTDVVGASRDNIGANLDQGSSYLFTLSSAPSIFPGTVTRPQNTPGVETIAKVTDDATPAIKLIVEVLTVPAGVFVNSIGNNNGTIIALVFTNCQAAIGENLVGLRVTDSDGESSTANLIINVTADTVPPTIVCPSSTLAVAARPDDTSGFVKYNQPEVSDNCSEASVVCNPPPGSAFPVGITTVTCTATDTAGNTAQCSFTVTVFDACLQDDSDSSRVLLFNSFTGDYLFCFNGVARTGRGSVIRQGSTFVLTHNPADRRVKATLEATQNRGAASLQLLPGDITVTITDRDISNNTCVCALL